MRLISATLAITFALVTSAHAADYPAPKQGDWIEHNFKFHTGEVMPELRLHYTTVGNPAGQPVLILHGTAGSGADMLTPEFAGELFGPGQPLDASKYFIVLPDAIGTGLSTSPSDGLGPKFPKYDYDDMVEAQHLLIRGLGIKHLRLVIGFSMGGMQTWMWGEKYPDEMDALVPMASQPTAMASRNWMLRRMLIETIRSDPAYKDGDYTTQPPMLRIASVFYDIASSGGTLGWQHRGPTNALANKVVDELLAAPPPKDANNYIWQWQSSADYDPLPKIERITAPLLAINSADDERNPPDTGLEVEAMTRVKHGRLYFIPESTQTRGHFTVMTARFYTQQLTDFLTAVPHRAM